MCLNLVQPVCRALPTVKAVHDTIAHNAGASSAQPDHIFNSLDTPIHRRNPTPQTTYCTISELFVIESWAHLDEDGSDSDIATKYMI